MKWKGGTYVLSTGRHVGHASNGILGISPEGEPELHSGYDNYAEEDFTPAERREIADAMIEAWNRWASQ